VIKPRVDLDDEHARLLTYDQAHAASVEHVDAVASVNAGIAAAIAGASVSSDIQPAPDPRAAEQRSDELADELTYRAALAALNGVVQRSLRDFLS
jgi:hypothetical protein